MNIAKKRVFVCGIHQESNSFNPIPTPKEMFGILEGEKSRNAITARSSTGGMMKRLVDEDDVEMLYGTVMWAPSGAPLEASVSAYFLDSVLPDIQKAGKLDGVAVSMHGATMAENSDDVCGDILQAIRKEVEKLPEQEARLKQQSRF